jgi:hypothetical protein
LGNNTRIEEVSTKDETKLSDLFASNGVKADPTGFKKIVRLSERPFYKSKTESQAMQVVPQAG